MLKRSLRNVARVMAASAAMIVLGAASSAFAQDAPPPASDGSVSGNLMLLNKIDGLRDQMQQMQGEIEELQHSLKELQRTSKDQYLDLDSRVGKLEHTAQAAPAASASAGSAATAEAALSGGAKPPATSAAPTSAAVSTPAAKAAYDAAFKSLRDGNYVASASGFRAFIQKFPSDPLVSNAYYWLGESYYVTQNFKIALGSFQMLLQHYPKSGKAPDAQLKVGYCQAELKDYAAARKTLQAVAKAYPGTPVERLAKKRLESIPAHAASAKR
jgi:tol-pal system protein YbgF